MSQDSTPVASRRVVLAGAGAAAVAALAGCSTYDQTAPPPDTGAGGAGADGTGDDGVNPAPSESAAPTGTAPAAGPPPLASTADIPVGGGKIFGDREVVVTQPQAGTFKAFNAICTHQGCVVAEVKNGTINCTCHGSKFRASDGSVANGPAARKLAPVNITVTGTEIRLA